ncbi:unnamed protein product [Caenorhabditis bovis]|uniref:Uncharacterized protein n=1 Tax=Caenorhabditis bovis TaxID=2654633 RepID=A0A8S1EFA5_9PELO|nr:unnamed protein product [Caenorhabditis bovis]
MIPHVCTVEQEYFMELMSNVGRSTEDLLQRIMNSFMNQGFAEEFKIIEMQQSVRTFINEGSELVKGTHNEKHAGFAQALYFAGLEADDYLLKLEYRAEAAFRITDAEIDVGRGKVEAVQQCLANLRTSIASESSPAPPQK